MKEINIPNINYNEEIKKCKTMDDVVGKNGLMKKLLETEMEEELERSKYENEDKNYRNGYSSKTVSTEFGDMELDIPRDRKSNFNPKIVKKYETDCNELDKKIIKLYARGMSVKDIQTELEELYGIDVSPSMISKITDKVMDSATEWQNRILDKIYPIVYMDAVHFKVRDEHRIVSKAVYICMGIYIDGYKDILIACMDGLKGLPDAIKSVFPNVCIQNCIIHQIRNSVRYVSYKDRKEFVSDLKTIYKAPTEEIALAQLDNFKDKRNKNYSSVIDSWYSNWVLFTYYSFYNSKLDNDI